MLSGCAQSGAQADNPTGAPDPATSQAGPTGTGPAAVELTEEQNGGTVALIVGDTMQIQLDGNPTTGYIWEADTLDTSLFEQAGPPKYTRNNNLTGGGGTYVFTFKALQAGSGHLRLIYHRTFEKGVAPLRVFDVTVDIQKKP